MVVALGNGKWMRDLRRMNIETALCQFVDIWSQLQLVQLTDVHDTILSQSQNSTRTSLHIRYNSLGSSLKQDGNGYGRPMLSKNASFSCGCCYKSDCLPMTKLSIGEGKLILCVDCAYQHKRRLLGSRYSYGLILGYNLDY